MLYFNDRDMDMAKSIYRLAMLDGHLSGSRIASLGAIKRKARTGMVMAFCERIQFKDISLTSMRHFQRFLFGRAVSNDELMRWATPGRKASDKVDMEVLASVAERYKGEAEREMKRLDDEWVMLRKAAAKAAGFAV